jgi:hypothetical protein
MVSHSILMPGAPGRPDLCGGSDLRSNETTETERKKTTYFFYLNAFMAAR